MVYDQAATARPPSGVLSSIHNGPDLLDPTGDWPVSLAESYSERYHHLLSPSTPWEDWFECLGHQGTYEWELGSDLLSRIVGHLSLHTWFPLPQILMVATSHNELYNGAQQLGFSTIVRSYRSMHWYQAHLLCDTCRLSSRLASPSLPTRRTCGWTTRVRQDVHRSRCRFDLRVHEDAVFISIEKLHLVN